MVGMIPAVAKDTFKSMAQRAAVGQTIRFPIAPKSGANGTVTPAAYGPDPSALTVTSDTLSIQYAKNQTWYMEAEEELGLMNTKCDPGTSEYDALKSGIIAQSFRALVNEIELALANQFIYASRAVKTGGATLFDATDGLGSIAQVLKILKDNGAPQDDLHLVLGTDAAAKMRSLNFLFKVNEAGTADLLRRGILGQIHGFDVHESAQIASHTNGTYTGATVTTLALAGTAITGTSLGSLLKGDLIKIANDDNNIYVLNADASSTAAVINAPGSKVAHAAATDGISAPIATSYIPNMAFAKTAIGLVTRAPALPQGGDVGEHVIVQDPVSGLAFDFARYTQYRRTAFEISIAYGTKAIKPDHIVILAQ
jgi:hypothetical protein